MATAPVLVGVVESFDREVGLGTLRGADHAEVAFHCTAISDGTRDIAVGTTVAYSVVAGHAGTTEARPVTPL